MILLPFLGVFIYVLVRGGSMHERDLAQAQTAHEQFQAYVRETAGSQSNADQLAKLADLRQRGVINEAEFDAEKAKILA